ncbi:HlyU family transcriptional regulator [Prosthecomicrobium sp. N25]|uniref:HlyU family transcriptional regulator n=1 Tax=Prosthecomicrobium sp. N25 TaxID=3129254 RepID=UPI0030773BAE
MSFFKKLFGLGGGAEGGQAPAKPAGRQEHNGFTIEATPFVEGGQHQVCGVISKEVDGVRREHRFIRADRFASKDDAVDMTFRKARQVIDERGDRVFD